MADEEKVARLDCVGVPVAAEEKEAWLDSVATLVVDGWLDAVELDDAEELEDKDGDTDTLPEAELDDVDVPQATVF